jgi:hypothetical protein
METACQVVQATLFGEAAVEYIEYPGKQFIKLAAAITWILAASKSNKKHVFCDNKDILSD